MAAPRRLRLLGTLSAAPAGRRGPPGAADRPVVTAISAAHSTYPGCCLCKPLELATRGNSNEAGPWRRPLCGLLWPSPRHEQQEGQQRDARWEGRNRCAAAASRRRRWRCTRRRRPARMGVPHSGLDWAPGHGEPLCRVLSRVLCFSWRGCVVLPADLPLPLRNSHISCQLAHPSRPLAGAHLAGPGHHAAAPADTPRRHVQPSQEWSRAAVGWVIRWRGA